MKTREPSLPPTTSSPSSLGPPSPSSPSSPSGIGGTQSPSPFYIGPFLISPHPLAPHFTSASSATVLFRQLITESQSSAISSEALPLLRELGLVSLWFLLFGILSTTGPYESLSDPVSIDMCNFRQSPSCLRPGARAAAFVPRGFFKSTIMTHGGGTFDLLRNPEERIVIVNAIYDKALEFTHQIQRNFTDCPLFAQLYPEWIPGKSGGKVTDRELILPNRRRSAPEPNLRALGITGAAEGGHYSTSLFDDLIGLDTVNSDHMATASMENSKKWFRTNRRALRLNNDSRLIVSATRYAIDDVYEDIYQSCRALFGYQGEDIKPSPDGEWDIYYRLFKEDGVLIRPNVMSDSEYERLLKDDYWAAIVNYSNAPRRAGLSEFGEASVGDCALLWDPEDGRPYIRRYPDPNFPQDIDSPDEIYLEACDVVVSTDLAATEKRMSAKTCRSSIALWATDSRENHYRLWSRVGYFSVDRWFEYLFEVNRLFRGYIRTTLIESNAFQKIIKPLLEREMAHRSFYFSVTAVMASGDKKARIRSALGQALPRGQIWLARGASAEFIEELRMFPMADNKLDVLDETEKALVYSYRPLTEEERIRREEDEEERMAAPFLSAVGY